MNLRQKICQYLFVILLRISCLIHELNLFQTLFILALLKYGISLVLYDLLKIP